MPTNAEALRGTWKDQWGSVALDGEGNTISGKWASGDFTGTISGDAIAVKWSHADGTTGTGTLSANGTGDTLSGTWGWDSDTDGGEWVISLTKRAPAPAPAPAPAAEEKPAEDKPAEDKPAEDKPAEG